MTRVLLAFDKFKDAMTARAAGEVVAAALQASHPDWVLDQTPLADGGEGFAAILTQAANGREVTGVATGPRGERLQVGFGLVPVSSTLWTQAMNGIADSPEDGDLFGGAGQI